MNAIENSCIYTKQSSLQQDVIKQPDAISEKGQAVLNSERSDVAILLNNIIENVCHGEGCEKVVKVTKAVFTPERPSVEMNTSKLCVDFPQEKVVDETDVLYHLQNIAYRQANQVFNLYRMFLKGEIETSPENYEQFGELIAVTRDAWEAVEACCIRCQDEAHEEMKANWSWPLKNARKTISDWEYAIQNFDLKNEGVDCEDLDEFPFATLIWKGSKQGAFGEIEEIRILRTLYKYPFIRIEETRDSNGELGPKTFMVADQLMFILRDPSHLEAIINRCNELEKPVTFIRNEDEEPELDGLLYFTSDFHHLEFPPLWLEEVLAEYECSYMPNYILHTE